MTESKAISGGAAAARRRVSEVGPSGEGETMTGRDEAVTAAIAMGGAMAGGTNGEPSGGTHGVRTGEMRLIQRGEAEATARAVARAGHSRRGLVKKSASFI